jgi:hypothetical protein
VAFGVGADLGFPDPDVVVDTVRTVSFSGQNKIARIAITSRTITMVGQWAFVNDHSDEACAVCGTVFCVVGCVCATTGVDGVVAGADPADTAGVLGAVAVDGVFTATDDPAACVTATGVDATGATGALPAVAIVFAIATSVFCMPFNVDATVASCEGVSVVFATTDALSCVSIVASVLKVPWNALTWLAESSVVATGAALCETVPGVPASAGGTAPACICKLASVAFATSSCC